MDSQAHCNNEVNTGQPRNYATSRKQRKWLERAHVHHPLLGRNSAQFGPLRGGCWVRGGLERVRMDLEGVKLVDAVEWQGTRQGRPWDATEQSLIDELDVRTLNATDLTQRRLDSRPIWLDDMVRDQFGDGAPVKSGFYRFIGDLLFARRAHAVGLRLSQTEAGAVYSVSDRQWRRWMATAEDAGIVRIIQTWEADRTTRSRNRRFGKLVYMLGPAIIERGGMALLEGLDVPLRDGRSCKRPAYHAARKLRAARTKSIRATRNRLWTEKEARRDRVAPSLNCLDITSASPPPKGRGIGGPGEPGQGKLRKAEVCATRTLSQALPPNQPPAGASRMGPALAAKSRDKSRKRGSVPSMSSDDVAVYGESAGAFAELWAKLGGAVHVLLFFAASLAATACDVRPPTDVAFYFFSPRPDTSGVVGATHGGYTKKSDGSHGASRTAGGRPGSLHFRHRWPYRAGEDGNTGRAPVQLPGPRDANSWLSGGWAGARSRWCGETRPSAGGARLSWSGVGTAPECRWTAAESRTPGNRVEVTRTCYLGPVCPVLGAGRF